MDRKLLILLIIILVLVVFPIIYFSFFSNFILKESIVLDKEKIISPSQIDSNVLSAKSHNIIYRYDDSVENYYIQKAIFRDGVTAENFTERFLSETRDFMVNKNSLIIGNFIGYSFDIIGIESEEIDSYGMLIKRDNVLIYGIGKDIDNLFKVGEWFINQY